MLSVNTNISSLNAQRSLLSNSQGAAVATERLASGKRINSAKDDAAGLAIASRLESQVKGVTQGIRNLSDATSVLQLAEGGMASIETNLQRIRELAVQAANGSYSDADRSSLNNEATQLLAEIDRVATSTSFGGQSLLDGTFTNKSFNLGNSGQNLIVTVGGTSRESLSLSAATTVTLGTVSGTITEQGENFAATGNKNGVSVAVATETGSVNDDYFIEKIDATGISTQSVTLLNGKNNGLTLSNANAPDLAFLSDGSVVALVNKGDDVNPSSEIHMNILSSNNVLIASKRLNVGTIAGEDYTLARVVDLGNSEFAVAWNYGPNNVGSHEVQLQRYDYDGNALGGVHTITQNNTGSLTTSNEIHLQHLAKAADGDVVAAVFDRSSGTKTDLVLIKTNPTTGTSSSTSTLASFTATNTPFGNASFNFRTDHVSVAAGTSSYTCFWVDQDTAELFAQSFNNDGTVLSAKSSIATDVISVDVSSKQSGSGRDRYDLAWTTRTGGVNDVYFKRFAKDLSSTQGAALKVFSNTFLGSQIAVADIGGNVSRVFTSTAFRQTGFQDISVEEIEPPDLTSGLAAIATLSTVDTALSVLNINRSEIGAQMNRIESAVSTLQITKENSAAAKSRIVDADYAAETARLAKHQILQQASISVLAQANSRPEMVLALLRGL